MPVLIPTGLDCQSQRLVHLTRLGFVGPDSHVRQQTEEESGERRDGGRSSNEVSLDFVLTQKVVGVLGADGVVRGRVLADTGASGVGDYAGVDGEDVRHGEEGDDAGADLCEKLGAMTRASLTCHVPQSACPANALSVIDGVTHMAGAFEAKPVAHTACGYPLVDA